MDALDRYNDYQEDLRTYEDLQGFGMDDMIQLRMVVAYGVLAGSCCCVSGQVWQWEQRYRFCLPAIRSANI